jgi:hypothetical protein
VPPSGEEDGGNFGGDGAGATFTGDGEVPRRIILTVCSKARSCSHCSGVRCGAAGRVPPVWRSPESAASRAGVEGGETAAAPAAAEDGAGAGARIGGGAAGTVAAALPDAGLEPRKGCGAARGVSPSVRGGAPLVGVKSREGESSKSAGSKVRCVPALAAARPVWGEGRSPAPYRPVALRSVLGRLAAASVGVAEGGELDPPATAAKWRRTNEW